MFNWLQLTDLHWGLKGQRELISQISDRFFDDLCNMAHQAGPWNCVFFTGDLVQKGAEKEYEELRSGFLKDLKEALGRHGVKEPLFFAVPGNHDLDRTALAGFETSCKRLLDPTNLNPEDVEAITNPLFDRPLMDTELGCAISAAFRNYSKWWNGYKPTSNSKWGLLEVTESIDGRLPGDFSATIVVTPQPGGSQAKYKVGVVGLNTTFVQLASGNYRGKLAVHPAQIAAVCGNNPQKWVMDHDACLLLTHQGSEWLTKKAQENLRFEINPPGRFALHLYGHEHVLDVQSRSVLGGPNQNTWQGSPLFSMEPIESMPTLTERRHGYAFGRVDRDAGVLRLWPRQIKRVVGRGWWPSADRDACVFEDDDESLRVPLMPVRAVSWQAVRLDRAQQDLKRELLRTYVGDEVVIRHLGLDMSLAIEKLLETFEDAADRKLSIELLMLSEHVAEYPREPLPKPFDTWPNLASKAKGKILKGIKVALARFKARSGAFTIVVRSYAEIPTIHGFSLGIRKGNEFQPKVTYFSYCRWGDGERPDAMEYDWKEDRYWKISHDRLDQLSRDMYSIFDGEFRHLWEAYKHREWYPSNEDRRNRNTPIRPARRGTTRRRRG